MGCLHPLVFSTPFYPVFPGSFSRTVYRTPTHDGARDLAHSISPGLASSQRSVFSDAAAAAAAAADTTAQFSFVDAAARSLARSLAASSVVLLHLLRCTPIVELPRSCASCGELAMTSSMAAAHQLCVSAKLNAPVYSQRPHLQQQQCRIHACASGCLLPPQVLQSLAFISFFFLTFFIFEAEVGLSSNAVDFRMSNLVMFFASDCFFLKQPWLLRCAILFFYFFFSWGLFNKALVMCNWCLPMSYACLPACPPALHIQYVLKMMEHVIVGFVFFLGFWNELNSVKFVYIS